MNYPVYKNYISREVIKVLFEMQQNSALAKLYCTILVNAIIMSRTSSKRKYQKHWKICFTDFIDYGDIFLIHNNEHFEKSKVLSV